MHRQSLIKPSLEAQVSSRAERQSTTGPSQSFDRDKTIGDMLIEEEQNHLVDSTEKDTNGPKAKKKKKKVLGS